MRKQYRVNIQPIRWSRPEANSHRFYDGQTQEKALYAQYIIRDHDEDRKFKGPLALEVTFYMPVPPSRKKRMPSIYCYTTPYLNTLIKFLSETITKCGDVWDDDRQVVKMTACKIYDAQPRVEFTIHELDDAYDKEDQKLKTTTNS